MNQQERDAFEEELIDDLCKVGFRSSRDEDGNVQIVVNDLIKACMPAILSRIETANSKVPKPGRKRVSIRDKAYEGFVAGWRAARDEKHFGSSIAAAFEEWWEKGRKG